MAFYFSWSTSANTSYLSREFVKKEFQIPTDKDASLVHIPSAEVVIIDNDKNYNEANDRCYKIHNCYHLTDIITQGVKPVPSYFNIQDCPKLTSLSFSDSIVGLGGDISNCPNLHFIRLPQNINYISTRLFNNIDSLEFVVPKVAKNKFSWKNNILWDLKNEIIIYAQKGADSLVLFPKELEHLDSLVENYYPRRVFRNAKNEKPQIIINRNTIVRVNMYNNSTIDFSDTIYNNITTIGEKAFYNCQNLQEIILPQNLVEIDVEAFANCTSLRYIKLPSSLKGIDAAAFSGCASLSEIILPDSLTDLGAYVFSGCSQLQKIHLPDSLEMSRFNKVICSQFDGCDSLSNVTFSDKSLFNKRDGVIFYKNEPCFFIGKNINYNDSTIKNKDGILAYTWEIRTDTSLVHYSQDIHVTNHKHHVSFMLREGRDIRVNPVVHNTDSVEYLPLFQGQVALIGVHKIRKLHIANTSPQKIGFFLPNSLKSEITLYVPYGCKKYFNGSEYAAFKEIKEDSWHLRVKNMLHEMLDYSLSQSKTTYIFCIAIVLFVFIFIYLLYKRRYIKKHSRDKVNTFVLNCKGLFVAFSTLFVFLLTWMSIYWTIFFAFESNYAMAIGHFIGIIGGVFTTWVLVYARNANIWMAAKRGVHLFIAKCRALTLADVKRFFIMQLKKVSLYTKKILRWIKKQYKICMPFLLICILIGVFLHKRDSWSEAIEGAELIIINDLNKDNKIKAESLLYNSMPRWKFLLSEQQQNDLITIYEKIADEIPNTKVIKEISEKGHNDDINTIAFSHNESLIITGSNDNTAIIWDAETGDTIRTLRGHKYGGIHSVVFSHDDKYIVTGSSDDTAIIWNTETGDTIRTLKGHKYNIYSVAFSHDNKYIVTGSSDETAIIWDTETGDSIRILKGHKNSINSVAFSHDKKYIVTGSSDNTAIIWNTEIGDTIRTLKGHKHNIYSVAFSHDGKYIVTGSSDNTAIIWTIETGTPIRTLKAHKNSINSVAFSHDDKYIVTGSSDDTAIIWNTETGDTIRSLKGFKGIRSVSFNQDGTKIFIGTNKKVSIIDLKSSDKKLINTKNKFTFEKCKIIVSNHKVCIYNDDEATIWNTITGDTIPIIKEGHTQSIESVVFSHDGNYAASCLSKGTAAVWNVLTGDYICSLRKYGHNIETIAFSHNDSLIVTSSSDNTVIIWDAMSGDTIRIFKKHKSTINSVGFSLDDKLIVTASSDSTAIISDVTTGDSIFTWKAPDNIEYVSFTSDNNVILGLKWDVVKLNNWETEKTLNTTKHELMYNRIKQFSPDCRYVMDSHNNVYDVETGKLLYKIHCPDKDKLYFAAEKDEFYIISNKCIQKVKLMSLDERMKTCHSTLNNELTN